MSKQFQPPASLTLHEINRELMPRVGTECWEIHIEAAQQWLLGSLPELAEPTNNDYLTFKSGPWTICSHYDYVWSMYGYYSDLDPQTPLPYIRSTLDSATYGFISKEAAAEARNDVREEEGEYGEELSDDRIEEFLIHRSKQLGGNVEFGRGSDNYYLFVAKENNQIVAWALLLDRVVTDVLEFSAAGLEAK